LNKTYQIRSTNALRFDWATRPLPLPKKSPSATLVSFCIHKIHSLASVDLPGPLQRCSHSSHATLAVLQNLRYQVPY